MILFSIPVHERPEVVVNQVENFRHFNPGCQIVLHISAWMPEPVLKTMKMALSDHPYVYLNDTRIWSGYADGTQMKMHIINYLYAQKLTLEFDYFCPHASNDMFVRDGLEEYMKRFDAGGSFHERDPKNKTWIHGYRSLFDTSLKRIMKKYDLFKIYGGQLEGSFYRKKIMDEVVVRAMTYGFYEIPGVYAHGYSPMGSRLAGKKKIRAIFNRICRGVFYAKEEVYFTTLSQDLVTTRAPFNYCYVNWLDNLKITKEDVDHVRSGNFDALSYTRHIPVPLNDLQFFAVKRVDRNINDPMRLYITSLQSLTPH